jgi:hypothetical protein
MSKLVVNGLNPHPLAIVDAAPFPVLGMDKMNPAVLKGPSGSASPIDILEPLDARLFNSIKAAKVGNSATEYQWAVIVKIVGESAVYFAALHNWGNKHSHRPSLQTCDNRNCLQIESNSIAHKRTCEEITWSPSG